MITKPPKITSKSSKKPQSPVFIPLKLLLMRLFIELKAHRKLIKLAQQSLGCRVARFRHNGKISPREYINALIKELTAAGIIEHWGEYEDTHFYRIAAVWVEWAYKIEHEAKRIAFESVSALHSQTTDCIENLTLYSSYYISLLTKPKRKSHKGKSTRRSSSYKRYFDSYFPQKFPDATAYQLVYNAKQRDLLMETYGVPFKPKIDYGLKVNVCMFEIELFEFEMEWL